MTAARQSRFRTMTALEPVGQGGEPRDQVKRPFAGMASNPTGDLRNPVSLHRYALAAYPWINVRDLIPLG